MVRCSLAENNVCLYENPLGHDIRYGMQKLPKIYICKFKRIHSASPTLSLEGLFSLHLPFLSTHSPRIGYSLEGCGLVSCSIVSSKFTPHVYSSGWA